MGGEFVGFGAPNYLAPDQTVDSADGQGTLVTQSRNWVWNGSAWVRETQPGGSGGDVTATGTLGALNAAVTVPLAGLGGAGVELEAGTLIGTVIAEASFDGGATWTTINFVDPASLATTQTIVFGSSNPQTTKAFQALGGMSHVRIRVSAYTSGSCTANLRATVTLTNVPGSGGGGGGTVNQGNPATLANAWPEEITDGTHGPVAVKAASTAAVATDPSLVVALSPNSPLPTGGNVIGAVTQNGAWTVTQGPAAALAGAWPFEVTDGAHGPVAVKAGSTAAVAADPSLVVALSPNSALPAGTNVVGAVNQGGNGALGQSWYTQITDTSHGPVAVKPASTAAAAADPSLVVALSPNSALPAGANVIGAVTQSGAPWSVSQSGAWTITQGNAGSLAQSWFTQITDGTHGPASVKAASTAVAATDPSLVVALSPNTPLPAGSNALGSVSVSNFPATQPVSGTVTANQGTANSLANAWPHEITDGTHGPAAVKAASTAAVAADPSLVVALSPNSPLPAGSAVIGAVTQSGAWTVQQGTPPWLTQTNDSTATGTLGALNAVVSLATQGLGGVGMELLAGTLVGTVIAEASYDGGTTWTTINFVDPASLATVQTIVFGSANPQTTKSFQTLGGMSHVRVRVSAYTSGSCTADLRATTTLTNVPGTGGGGGGTVTQGNAGSLAQSWYTQITDGTHGPAAVKAASTAAVAADPSLVVALSPNSPLPSGPNIIGAVKITDGTLTPAVKGASTAATAADPSLVIALSPNSPLPAGTNALGSVSVTGTVTSGPLADLTAGPTALNALNATQAIATSGYSGVGMLLAAGTFIGTILAEVSMDGGTTWVSSFFYNPSNGASAPTIVFASNNPVTTESIAIFPGVSNARVRVVNYTSGTANATLRATVSDSLVAQINDKTTSGALGALQATVTLAIQGLRGAGIQLATGTLIGTIVPEVSFDGGLTFWATWFYDPSAATFAQSIVFSSANSNLSQTILIPGGVNEVRVRVSAYTSGTANCTLRGSTAHTERLLTSADVVTAQQGGAPWSVQGDAASGSSVAGNPLLQGGRAATALPTAVTDGQAIAAMLDSLGRTVTTRIPTALQLQNGNTTLTTGSSTQLIAAQASGIKIAVTHIHVSNTSATGVRVDILDGSTVIWSDFVAPSGGGAGEDFGVALLGSAATALNAQLSAAVTDVRVSVVAHQIK